MSDVGSPAVGTYGIDLFVVIVGEFILPYDSKSMIIIHGLKEEGRWEGRQDGEGGCVRVKGFVSEF